MGKLGEDYGVRDIGCNALDITPYDYFLAAALGGLAANDLVRTKSSQEVGALAHELACEALKQRFRIRDALSTAR